MQTVALLLLKFVLCFQGYNFTKPTPSTKLKLAHTNKKGDLL